VHDPRGSSVNFLPRPFSIVTCYIIRTEIDTSKRFPMLAVAKYAALNYVESKRMK
jgi:hypothetical protein